MPVPCEHFAVVTETFAASRTLHTVHAPELYPGIRTLRPVDWQLTMLLADEGQSFVAQGGEYCYGYRTVAGDTAQAFELHAGDRATLVRKSGLPGKLSAWRVERA